MIPWKSLATIFQVLGHHFSYHMLVYEPPCFLHKGKGFIIIQKEAIILQMVVDLIWISFTGHLKKMGI